MDTKTAHQTQTIPLTAAVTGRIRFEWVNGAGPTGSRRNKLYVPSGYRADTAVPLVVMLHGCTQSPEDFAAGTCMNEAAEARTFLVAYPEQTSASNMQKCWNWFVNADQRRDAGEVAGARYAVATGGVVLERHEDGVALPAPLCTGHPNSPFKAEKASILSRKGRQLVGQETMERSGSM